MVGCALWSCKCIGIGNSSTIELQEKRIDTLVVIMSDWSGTGSKMNDLKILLILLNSPWRKEHLAGLYLRNESRMQRGKNLRTSRGKEGGPALLQTASPVGQPQSRIIIINNMFLLSSSVSLSTMIILSCIICCHLLKPLIITFLVQCGCQLHFWTLHNEVLPCRWQHW